MYVLGLRGALVYNFLCGLWPGQFKKIVYIEKNVYFICWVHSSISVLDTAG